MLGDPVGMVVAIGSDKFNIFRLSDAMAESGYSVSQCQHPSCIHFCVTLRHVEHIDAIIESMRVETAKIMVPTLSPALPNPLNNTPSPPAFFQISLNA